MTKTVSASTLVDRINKQLKPNSKIWQGRDLRSPLGAFYLADSRTGHETRLSLHDLENIARDLRVLADFEVLGRAA
jgi:hypothetical protein